jgi:hypothetical protein
VGAVAVRAFRWHRVRATHEEDADFREQQLQLPLDRRDNVLVGPLMRKERVEVMAIGERQLRPLAILPKPQHWFPRLDAQLRRDE